MPQKRMLNQPPVDSLQTAVRGSCYRGASKIKTILLALGIAVPIIFTTAIVNSKGVMVWGSGNISCGSWTKEPKNSPTRQQREGWLFGFLSGYNWYGSINQDVSLEDGNALIAWMDNYCAVHPLDEIVVAASALIAELRRRKELG